MSCHLSRAPAKTLSRRKEGIVRKSGGHRKFRQRRPHPRQIEIALRCDALALLQARFASPSFPALGHLFRRHETPFAVRVQQPTRERVIYGCVVAESSEHIVHEPAVVVDVARLVTYHPRYFVSLGELDQRRSQRRFIPARVVELHFDCEPVAEDIAPLAKRPLSSLEIAGA